MSIFLSRCGLLFLLITLPEQTNAAPPAPEPPKPMVNISFARQTIRENDCLPVEVWFSNEGKQEITGVTLQIASAGFFRWTPHSCNDKDTDSKLLITLEPALSGQFTSSNSIRSCKLYLKTGPDIEVGDYNLLFTFLYSWREGEKVEHSLIASEKSIKVNFLGSESVAGVPLGLAGLIVPGLFFWIIVRALGVSWSLETPLGDKLIYSVVVSFIFVALASALVTYLPRLHYLDISSGISIRKLIWLACTGAGVGLVVSLLDYGRQKKHEKWAAATEINFSDDPTAIIGKLLRKNSTYHPSKSVRLIRNLFKQQSTGYKPQTIVKLKNGDIYAGSLGEKGKDLTLLAGWFKVIPKQGRAQLDKLRSKGLVFDLFTLARNDGLEILGSDAVKKLVNGQQTSTNTLTMVWPSSEVLQVVVEPGKGPDEALIVDA